MAGAPAPSREFFSRQDRGGPGVILRQPGGHSVEILLFGAQVVSWKTSGRENLFLLDSVPPRGGIRIYFPKFFDNQNVEQPGFARRALWSCEETDMPAPDDDDDMFADFSLDHMHIAPTDYANWPNKFEFLLRVILGRTGKLSMISRIKNVNTDGRSFTFPFSYENYFSVYDICAVRIGGLQRRDYLDGMRNGERFNQGDAFVTFDSAVSRLYLNAPNRIAAQDDWFGRTFTIEKSLSLPDIVVWNRWDEYRRMVCVEAAAQENEITLIPGQEWMAVQHLSVTVFNYNAKI